jgi:hypothetical protein
MSIIWGHSGNTSLKTAAIILNTSEESIQKLIDSKKLTPVNYNGSKGVIFREIHNIKNFQDKLSELSLDVVVLEAEKIGIYDFKK